MSCSHPPRGGFTTVRPLGNTTSVVIGMYPGTASWGAAGMSVLVGTGVDVAPCGSAPPTGIVGSFGELNAMKRPTTSARIARPLTPMPTSKPMGRLRCFCSSGSSPRSRRFGCAAACCCGAKRGGGAPGGRFDGGICPNGA
ncbi:hypothetical protein ACFPRL_12655 [Pseudoclavibacter helvolus]